MIERVASGVGDTVGFLARSGILFVVFALIWIAFAAAMVSGHGSLDAVWEWARDLPWIAQGAVWVLFLPVMPGLWIRQAPRPLMVRLLLVVGIAGWNPLVFPKPWRLHGAQGSGRWESS